MSMFPTNKVRQISTLNIDTALISPGNYIKVTWLKKPVVIYKPSKESAAVLKEINSKVWGPDIDSTSIKKIYIYEAISTYLGCGLKDTSEISTDSNFPNGWYDPCHMGVWDYSGRAYKSINVAKGIKLSNLSPVKYRSLSEDIIQLYP